MDERTLQEAPAFEQLDLFTDYEALEQERKEQEEQRAKERRLQEAMLSVKRKYGKNAVLKGTSFTGRSHDDRPE